MKITELSKGHIFGTVLWLEAINLNASSDNFSLKFGKSQRESSFNEVNDNFQISHLKVRDEGRSGVTSVLRTFNF